MLARQREHQEHVGQSGQRLVGPSSGPATTSSTASSSTMQIYCNGPTAIQTIEEQIKQIDRISKVLIEY